MSSSKDIIEFTIIYNKNKRKLYNYVYRMINDKMASEDIIQNVFMRLYEKLDSIRNKNSIVYWLYTSARNEIYTLFRNKKTHVDQYNVADTDEIDLLGNENPELLIEMKELKEIILKELDLLPPEQKEVYYLKEYAELSYKEIADIMKIDENLVKSRLFKTRQKLIKKITKVIIE